MRLLGALFFCVVAGCGSRPIVVTPPVTEMPSPQAKPLNAPCLNQSSGQAWVSSGAEVSLSTNLPTCQWAR